MRHVILIAVATTACATSMRKFDSREVLWEDADRHPVPEPDDYWTPMYWDVADKTIFFPISRALLLDVDGPATNVNALNEVPSSSWYQNRMALQQLDPETVARGACGDDPPISAEGPWLVSSGKVDGANPGFAIQDAKDGRRYLMKFDEAQGDRATAADVIGSKIYWAAGFSTPCNRIVFFERDILQLKEGASKKDELGRKALMEQRDIDSALDKAFEMPDGRYRASVSLFLPGKPIGPLTYDGIRSDDLNDAYRHEDRRELRGSRLLAAWLNHFDAREQNTFSSIVKAEGSDLGYVQHHILDFGDCFGSMWPSDQMTRRFGNSYYFSPGHVLGDLLTFGLWVRPWDVMTLYEETQTFGYFDIQNFVASAWLPAYRNPAFDKMDEVDGFWAAKIISRFSDAHIRRLVDEGKQASAVDRHYLERMIIGRRNAIVREYLLPLSALDLPRVDGSTVCFEDILVAGGYVSVEDSFYGFRAAGGEWMSPSEADDTQVCVDVAGLRPSREDYLVLEGRVRRAFQADVPRAARFHFALEGPEAHLVGIER